MCTPGIGAASDRYGRKPLMLLSALSGAIRALPALQPSRRFRTFGGPTGVFVAFRV